MDEVVGGAGEVNLTRSGEAALIRVDGPGDADAEAERSLGVVGRDSSVVGISESCESWDRDA